VTAQSPSRISPTSPFITAGATAIVYKIRAIRTTAAGLWATFNVVFGSNTGGGGMTVSAVADSSAPKLAA
jgi:hypothetical protein